MLFINTNNGSFLQWSIELKWDNGIMEYLNRDSTSKMFIQCIESKDGTSSANGNKSFMVFSFDVKVVYMMVQLLMKNWVEEKDVSQLLVYVP